MSDKRDLGDTEAFRQRLRAAFEKHVEEQANTNPELVDELERALFIDVCMYNFDKIVAERGSNDVR